MLHDKRTIVFYPVEIGRHMLFTIKRTAYWMSWDANDIKDVLSVHYTAGLDIQAYFDY
jgi:hypothetical protein